MCECQSVKFVYFVILRRQFLGQELPSVALLALGDLFGRALNDDAAAVVATLGTQVNDVVGTLDHFKVVLDDYHRVPVTDELVK